MSETEKAEQLLIEMYRQMHRAMVAADTQMLSSLLADDFRLVHMTGYDQSREEWLEHIDSCKMRYSRSDEHEVNAKLQGNAAQLLGRNFVQASIWGTQGTWPLQLDIHMVQVAGIWQMKAARASAFM